jgi:SAM-dependent methyltransferase
MTNVSLPRPWLSDEARAERMLEPYGRAVLVAAALRPGERVLDAGCGTGSFTLEAAEAAGRAGRAVGVDVDPLAVARARSRSAGVPQVDILCGDLQTADLGLGYFDVVVARFGTHVCADPFLAHANLARALRPGGRLTTVVWAEPEANPWHTVPASLVPGRSPRPGPFGLADADHHRDVLARAGFVGIELERLELPVLMGLDVEDAVSWFDGTFGAVLRTTLDPGHVARIEDELRSLLAPQVRPDGVWLRSAAWLATATRP